MIRDSKFLRRNSKCLDSDEVENIPANPGDLLGSQTCVDLTRPPLNTIHELIPTRAVSKQEHGVKMSKVDRTPTKMKKKASDPLQTHENQHLATKNRFAEVCEENRVDSAKCDSQSSRGTGNGAILAPITTPRSTKVAGRPSSGYSECSSTKSTPTKIVSKPPNPGLMNVSRPPVNGGSRIGSYAALSKGIPVSCVPSTVVNAVDVPHFDLNEDLSFWMEHNAQVLIRVRPLNNMERSTCGYNRCLKQESAQSITWVGQPETLFTFDHVACESIDQETLFKMAGLPMVENCLSGYNSCMFAYGQTGSGKTHTMLGEIEELQVKPSPNRGMTPRIFEFLFARIQAEEESRRDEKLKYKCKCSFLEIYNEQITDLLDPSSTNLSIREDIKKGVYVENLSEFEVQTVGDILTLLSQGSSNRRVAATNMNRESSRSHSVFTCVIESRWEKDAICNLRFARLNLVDLAGSERQKSSGAEGERLKEAANINKSLSTLGHVIMVLVDVANGKPRHIPYRDSKLTFLLQDSLGGNSKTMIIANVSPSMGCVAETLNTLKFAQRAKLIQNNAIVNEDSSEDIIALQHQIRNLKEELSFLRRKHVSRSISFGLGDRLKYLENDCEDKENEMEQQHFNSSGSESKDVIRMSSSNQIKSLETTLAGVLRREQIADSTIKQLEAEIEQLNLLVYQKEDDTRCTKMMLKFREEKIQRLESLVGGLITPDTYLLKENNLLSEEIQLLKDKLDRDPENVRILEQPRRVQDLYEGERNVLLSEVSQLGEQLNKALKDLEDCRNNLSLSVENKARVQNEVNVLCASLDCSTEVTKELIIEAKGQSLQGDGKDNGMMSHGTCAHHIEDLVNLQLEIDILKIILTEERSSHAEMEEKERFFCRDLELVNGKLLLMTKEYENVKAELKEATTVIESLESQQFLSIHEIDDLRNTNNQYAVLLKENELEISSLKEQISCNNVRDPHLEEKLKKMQESLEKAKRMNIWYQKARSFQSCNEEEIDEVCRQAEAETAEVIVCLQDEVNILEEQVHLSNQKETESKDKLLHMQADLEELQGKSFLMAQELQQKDEELRSLSKTWELFIKEIETNLVEGHKVLDDASRQFDFTSSSLIQRRSWIFEQVMNIQYMVAERDLLIQKLNSCLYDADEKRGEIENMLRSLRGAVLVITEAHQQECIAKENEIMFLKSELSSKVSTIALLENKFMQKEEQLQKASTCATAAFVVVNRLSEVNSLYVDKLNLNEGSLHNQDVEVRDLRLQLSVEKENTCIMEQKLEDTKKQGILKMGEKVSEVLNSVSELRSCIDISRKSAEDQDDDIIISKSQEDKPMKLKSDIGSYGDPTIVLLRNELESALGSLDEVEVEIRKLCLEKDEIRISENQCREKMKSLISQLLSFEAIVNNFEKQTGQKIASLDHKLKEIQELVQEASCCWFPEERESLRFKHGNAKKSTQQISDEPYCSLSKFKEAHITMMEADMVINGLMIANETMKLEVKELKKIEITLTKDKNSLVEHYKSLEEKYASDMKDLKKVVMDLSEIISSTVNPFKEEDYDVQIIKSQVKASIKLMHTWIEDVWSEVILRDCAISVLHLCHMGIMLETVTGLNAENDLLKIGLCESNTVVSELRNHNSKSRKELEMCRALKGKILAGIKDGFDRITKKGGEANSEVKLKLDSFEKKIFDLQLQEELMLNRFKQMGSELTILIKEMDFNSDEME
ncbi:kinesin-like protein KIN-12D isoform X2 [Impatiens glandulifera]|uniref:kinesin-like protein KIN-12D isoform X2 n=1 Tax=Impatiens glandulifera TaxID=253017 RepID=UPI001FB16034|nr:kinesin-like protein KIN-12D isoform X2 [Impatiens glandulifera]